MVLKDSSLDLKGVKLVIWDLDNTLWEGVLSEGKVVPIGSAIEMVKELTEHGIVNSICSKNTLASAKDKLEELGIWDYFVFPSIDWTPKNKRVIDIIHSMGLRPSNVLFLDDEKYNQEAVSFEDGRIICSSYENVQDCIFAQIQRIPVDANQSRLRQYRELQFRYKARKNYVSDDDFLRDSGIKLKIGKDCNTHFQRIIELIIRTNQLNFTKIRLSEDELHVLLENPDCKCGYIEVRDKYSDYGIVGFYALQENSLEHFLFSCRTIGMGIEQYVYFLLGYPSIQVKGEVVSSLNRSSPPPDWIEQVEDFYVADQSNNESSLKILIKGPCDVSQVIPFFADKSCIKTEFSYTSKSKHTYIESHNHLSQILLNRSLSAEDKNHLINTLPFIDEEYFKTDLFSGDYDYVVLSLLPDYGLGLYQSKQNPSIIVPFNQYTIDYSVQDNWVEIMRQQSDWSDDRIVDAYKVFSNDFVFLGRESDDNMLKNLSLLRSYLPQHTKLVLVNGSTIPYRKKTKYGYENRHSLHSHLNDVVEMFASSYDNVIVLDVNQLIHNDNEYLDTINHYKKIVYYKMAEVLHGIIVQDNGIQVPVRSRFALVTDAISAMNSKIKGVLFPLYSKLFKHRL